MKNQKILQGDAEQNSAVPSTNEARNGAGELGAAPSPLRRFKSGHYEYGVAFGPTSLVITESDFCHSVYKPGERIELRAAMPWEKADSHFQTFTREQLESIATPILSYREWAHYWGIKSRVRDNYVEFLKSMREVGADTGAMPEWGKEPAERLRDLENEARDYEWERSQLHG